MTEYLKPHLEILPSPQRQLWPQLRAVTERGFVLYGGTAIALRLAHRQSVDFDFFSSLPLEKERLWREAPLLSNSIVIQDEPNTLTVLVTESASNLTVKVLFFGGLTFGRVGIPQQTDDGVLQVASLRDLFAQKVKTILQRIEAKDYRDIAALISSGVQLDDALAAARLMFGGAFQPSESLKAMTYFRGGDLDILPEQDRKTLVEAVARVRELPPVELLSGKLSL